MRIDFTDGSLFGNDAGEDEDPEILNSYFVDQPGFHQFLSRKNAFRVARSRKGMGKSALLSKLAYDLVKSSDPAVVIKVTGANLINILQYPSGVNFLELQNYWQRIILQKISTSVASNFGFIFSDTRYASVSLEDIAAFGDSYISSILIDRVVSQGIPVEIVRESSLSNGGLDVFKNLPQIPVWILVDDIDSTYVDTDEQRALISTFFSACRALVRDVKGLYIRASVRTDVWSNLRANEDLDKCEQYVTDIQWSANDMKVILSKKVFSYFKRIDNLNIIKSLDYRDEAESVLELAFERRVRWGNSHVPPFRPVYILSAGRPRWMSQLCRLAGVQASKNQKQKIGTTEINSVSRTYSRYRLDDIYKEHSHQYSGLQTLIEAFSNASSRYKTAELLTRIAVSYVNPVGAINVPAIDGLPYAKPVQIAHFLYKIGFLLGRRDQPGGESANYVKFEERPELLTESRNLDDGLVWEIHPAYRSILNIRNEAAPAASEMARRSNSGVRRTISGDKGK